MKLTRLILILSTSLLLGGCSLFGGKKAGLQVTANPQANIFLDNKSLGQTPVYQEGIKPGSYTLKIAAADQTLSAWEGKITLNAGALTVIDRQLAADPAKSFGYTLTFEALANKTATEVNLVSFPDTVSVMVDGAPVGFTPFKSDSIAAGGHTFTLTSPGYQDQVIKASIRTGNRLVINVQLGAQTIVPTPTPIATPSATPTLGNVEITPLPKQATNSAILKPYVEILATPDNNRLKVRSENVIGNNIIAIVNTGDKFPYFATSGSWFQIEYLTGKKGWVSSTYAKLIQ
ncbi:MAG: PEGA domain-containing protein [Microgenomates group bacterium]